ncbi:MAG: hypothetical protein ACFFC3_11905 [Candidatus Odinarchaeota archaeon]
MSLIKRLKLMKRSQFISIILLTIILVYGLTYSLVFILISNSLLNTIGSIRIPNGYYYSDLEVQNPVLEFSFRIDNNAFIDINELYVNIIEYVLFFENYNNTEKRLLVFQENKIYNRIPAGQSYEDFFIGNKSNFDNNSLKNFLTNINATKGIRTLLDIEIGGSLYYKLVPFQVKFKDFCPTCGIL